METWSFVDGVWKPGDLAGAEVRWFDIVGPAAEEMHLLAGRFGLHPLSVEDCVSLLPHAPKVDEFEDHLFLVFHTFARGEDGLETEELNVFLGSDFLITYRDREIADVASVHRVLSDGHVMRPGADGLLHEIIDRVVDAAFPLVSELADRMDDLQLIAIDPQMHVSNERVLAIRASAGKLRRLLVPQLGVVQRLSRGEFREVREANRMYFRDVYDHLVRIDFALEEVREDAEVALTSYLSAVNNRMNEVMKVLSIVAVLALPATVITGIFGTNFDDIPGLHSNWGFAAMVGVMLALSSVMLVFFRRRRWF